MKPPALTVLPFSRCKVLTRRNSKPTKIICVGLNYRDHAIESKMEIPTRPTIFSKYNNTVIGSGDNIVIPNNTAKPDYEAEFAFVIGKGGRHIKGADWADHVFGYMNLNDVSARDVQLAVSQWVMGKTFDTFAPMGPYLVTADEIADPHNLNISLTLVNAETIVRTPTTRELMSSRFPSWSESLSSVADARSWATSISTDCTPRPASGMARKSPPKWLKAGDLDGRDGWGPSAFAAQYLRQRGSPANRPDHAKN